MTTTITRSTASRSTAMPCANTATRVKKPTTRRRTAPQTVTAAPPARPKSDPTALLGLVARYRNNGLGLDHVARRLGVTTERLKRALAHAHLLVLQGVA